MNLQLYLHSFTRFCLKTLKYLLNMFFHIYVSEEKLAKTVRSIVSNNSSKSVFLFPSPGTPWSYMFQRPQQLALSLSKQDNLVFYSVEGNYKFKTDNITLGVKQVKENLYLYNDFRKGSAFPVVDKGVLWRYWASQYDYLSENTKKKCIQIYDWIDDTNVQGYDDKLLDQHKKLLLESDIVIVTAEILYDKALKIRKDTILVPNACDYEHFSKVKPVNWPVLDKIKEKSEVVVGYYGAIAEWFDFDLVNLCAKTYPHWTFVLVGQIYPGIQKSLRLNMCPNIIILNRVDYSYLPYFLSQIDMAIIPFRLNEITHATSPVKLYEYMAGGKPCVCTAMKEVLNIGHTLIANNYASFVEMLKQALNVSKNIEYIDKLRYNASLNSWDNRIKLVLSELKVRGVI